MLQTRCFVAFVVFASWFSVRPLCFFSSGFFNSISWVRQFSCDFFRGWKTTGMYTGRQLNLLYLENGGRKGGFFYYVDNVL